MDNAKRAIVLIITGPPGVGKTTVAKLAAARLGYAYVSGDEIKNTLFPELVDVTQDRTKLEVVNEELFRRAKEAYDRAESVIVDYVLLEEGIGRYRRAFGDDVRITVLLPPAEAVLDRDRRRECWTAGEESVMETYRHFEELKGEIEGVHFIDSAGESPEETAAKIRIE